jgi:Cysteine-rich secretory protein family
MDKKNALEAHRNVRQAPLLWDATMARESMEQAQKITAGQSCDVATVDQWDLDPNARYGRNTFAIHGTGCDWDSVVKSWSAEKIDPSNLNTGAHKFQTQGKDVTTIGCARASSGQCEAFVCQYSPKQTIVAGGNFEESLIGPEIACPQTCGGVLPCRNTEL